jgi:predicted nucleic acid-binding protein
MSGDRARGRKAVSMIALGFDVSPREDPLGNHGGELPDSTPLPQPAGRGAPGDHGHWWRRRRPHFDLYVSRLVVDEASAGDADAAERRLVLLKDVPRLEVTQAASVLAARLVAESAIPREAVDDALHVAIAAAHGMDYLLTWNCRHIANAAMRNRIADVCMASGLEAPVICTPEELLED